MSKISKIQLWAPNIIDETGGIQVFSKFLLKALLTVRPDTAIELFLIHDKSKNPIEGIVPHTYGGIKVQFIRKIAFALKVLFSNRADLIIATHVHFGPLARVISSLKQTPYWLVAHGVDAWDLSLPRRWGARGANKVLSVSKFTTAKMQRLKGGEAFNFVDFPNTFSEDNFSPTTKESSLLSKLSIPSDSKIILTVGRLSSDEQYKGHDLIIRSINSINKELNNVHYLIVGSGDDLERLQSIAKEEGVSDRIHFTGFIPDSDLPTYYNLCDVFAMPSRGEGFGIVYLEALACGKPCIASSVDGGQDALLGGELGELVDLSNNSDLINSLVKTLSNNDEKVSGTRRDKTIKHFGFKAFCDRLNSALTNFESTD